MGPGAHFTQASSRYLQRMRALPGRLLADMSPLRDRLWLVIDDVHELRSEEVRKRLELLVLRAPPQLQVVLATRRYLGATRRRPRCVAASAIRSS